MSNAMKVDRYELSMLQSLLAAGTHNKKATFEVFTRRLPDNFRFGVFAGTGRLFKMVENLEFSEGDIQWLLEDAIIDQATADYLTGWQFNGEIEGYEEGDLFFPNSPVLTVAGTLAECLILETLILSVLNWDSAIATKAARIRMAAGPDAHLIEMGSRRTNEDAAVAAARAAYIGGFNATSNLMAGKEHQIPTAGTAAHAFTLVHDEELDAFRNQISTHGVGTSLLVDTYDVAEGVRNAVVAAQEAGATGPGSIRIDSGDLAANAHMARRILDSEGATDTQIAVTSDLDEYVITDLRAQGAPIDTYGVGTKLVSTPPIGFVYKVVEIETTDDAQGTYMRPVHKKAKDKVSYGGRKKAVRTYDGKVITGEFAYPATGPVRHSGNPLTRKKMSYGMELPPREDATWSRNFFLAEFESLPESEKHIWSASTGPFLTTRHDNF